MPKRQLLFGALLIFTFEMIGTWLASQPMHAVALWAAEIHLTLSYLDTTPREITRLLGGFILCCSLLCSLLRRLHLEHVRYHFLEWEWDVWDRLGVGHSFWFRHLWHL